MTVPAGTEALVKPFAQVIRSGVTSNLVVAKEAPSLREDADAARYRFDDL
jgi:hypothetical protein